MNYFPNYISSKLKKVFQGNRLGPGAIDQKVVNSKLSNPNFPYLISFPRTGSHWVRIFLEEYTNRPLLARTFLPHPNDDFLLYHTHDTNLNLRPLNVLYLYRNPVDVIHSQLQYYKQRVDNQIYVVFWSCQYAMHLLHWLYDENLTQKKSLISFDKLQKNLASEFKKICTHLDLQFDLGRLNQANTKVTKAFIKSITQHDSQVIKITQEYEEQKQLFRKEFEPIILSVFQDASKYYNGNKSLLNSLFEN